ATRDTHRPRLVRQGTRARCQRAVPTSRVRSPPGGGWLEDQRFTRGSARPGGETGDVCNGEADAAQITFDRHARNGSRVWRRKEYTIAIAKRVARALRVGFDSNHVRQ